MFELTETALFADREGAAAFVRHLRCIGCHVALDDFGVGYNTFARIKDIPADALKIDIRPFQPTALVGCIKVRQLQRFLVATTEKDVGQAYESGARESVKAASKGGYYYSTDAVKVKLPYAATGEMVLTVSQAGKDKDCVDAATADAKDAKDEDGKGKQAAG